MHGQSMDAGLSAAARIDQPGCVCVGMCEYVPTNQTEQPESSKKVLGAPPNGSRDGKQPSTGRNEDEGATAFYLGTLLSPYRPYAQCLHSVAAN